jgi:4-amino-4-deoxy-L-arabinose transferase-like glycosyltransferase
MIKNKSGLVDLLWIVILTALALILRVVYCGARPILSDHDSSTYIVRAQEIFGGGSLFNTYHMPGYPLMIGFWSMFVGDYVFGARMATIVSGSLLVVVVYIIGKSLYGRSTAIVAGALIATNRALIDISAAETSGALYTVSILSAVAVTVWAVRAQRTVIWVLAGFLFGFSYWVRPEGFVYLGLIPLVAFIEHWIVTGAPLSKRLLVRVAGFLIAGGLFLIPNVLYIHAQTGSWTVNGRTVWAAQAKSSQLEGPNALEQSIYGLTPDKKAIMLEGGFGKVSMIRSYSENIGFKLKGMVKNWGKTYDLLPRVFPQVLLLFLGIGLFRLRWVLEERRAEVYLLGALLPWVVVYPLYEIEVEKLSPVVPFLTLWAALGVVDVAERIRSSALPVPTVLSKMRNPSMAMAAVVVFVAALDAPAYLQPLRDPNYFQYKEDDPINRTVGEWIRQNLSKDTTLMARKKYVGAYSGRRIVFLPFADYPDMIAYARHKGVDIIVMDEKFKALRPQLEFLFDESGHPEDLVPIYSAHNEKGQKIILYKLLPEKNAVIQ